MRGLTLACISIVVAVSQAMTTITAPIAPISTTSSPTTTTINPLLQRRIDSEISRLTRRLQMRIRGLQRGSGRLDRSIASLQSELDFNNAILADLPELVKNILISNPSQRLSSRTIDTLMRSLQNAASGRENFSEESAEVEDRRRRAIFEVTSSFVIVEGTTDSSVTTNIPEVTTQAADTTTIMETTAAPGVTSIATETTTEMTTQAPDTTTVMETTAAPGVTSIATETTTEMTTQAPDTTTVMETTAAPEVTSLATETTTEMTTQEADTTTVMETTAAPEVTSMAAETTTEMTIQGTTLSPFLVRRINSIVSRIGRFFQRRVQRILRSVSRLGRFRLQYKRLIDENTSALDNLPLLVRDLITSPFQRRLRLSQVFRALRLRLRANNTNGPSEIDDSQTPSRKRREVESGEAVSTEVDDDLVGDMEDLKELDQEVQEALEEIEKLDL